MNSLLNYDSRDPFDVPAFLLYHGFPKTVEHSANVAAEAECLARRLGEDCARAQQAAWLHDVSVVIPTAERVPLAQSLGMEVLPEEAAFPMILHQRLSAVLAREIFGVQDETVLSAIACHTTLKPNATCLDKVVFLADKLAWDQPGIPPYLSDMRAALDRSLDAAVFVYLRYLWDMRETLRVIHPWFVAAYQEYKGRESRIENQEMRI
ncbi:MAG: bis(5'-nucleosyl)-tetraphosphatase (symmetrical) YqeK [Anaerolineae bacterium]|nr:bis(5'-nucleosyl)-tetraphosphatase (symmetrical) YqeK [Anaerolineae bacterium]